MRARILMLAALVTLNASVAAAQDDPPRVTSADLRLTLSAVKPRVLVGEFTKVKIDWLALRQVDLLPGAEYLQIDDGTGFKDHGEASINYPLLVASTIVFTPGETTVTERVIGMHSLEEIRVGLCCVEALNAGLTFAFARPGTYRVKGLYDDVESNVITIEVVAPSGSDATLLEALRATPGLLVPAVSPIEELRLRAKDLIAAYGGHVYLVPTIRHLYGGEEYMGASLGVFEGRAQYDVSQSAFAADEALWRARVGHGWFGDAWGVAAFQRVVEEFPNRRAALLAADELAALERAAAARLEEERQTSRPTGAK